MKDLEAPAEQPQRQRSRKNVTNGDPLLAAPMGDDDDPMISANNVTIGTSNQKKHPFFQVSALTDSNRTDINDSSMTNHPFFDDNAMESGSFVRRNKDNNNTHPLLHGTTIISERTNESGASHDLLVNHVGLRLPDLFIPTGIDTGKDDSNAGSPQNNTAKSAPALFEIDSDSLTAPPSPTRRPSEIYAGCPPSPGRLSSMRPRGSTFNLYPKSLIEGNSVKVEHLDDLPRLVRRDRHYHQSSNKAYIRHNQGTRIYKLLKYNWFHVFLRWKTRYSLTILLSFWTVLILVFAGIYVGYDHLEPSQECGLGAKGDPISFAGAFAFSLETCTTVGYGLPNGVNSFFNPGCSGLQVIIYFQMAWSMIFNAFLITFLYNRLGRSESRSTQVIFSNKALVSIVDGQIRFQIRIFDCDAKHPVVEAHVRMYCIMKHRPVPRPLRILQPDDELGATMFLSFPTIVNHNIDMYSLLHPPSATVLMKPRGLVLRQVDGDTANRDDVICPVCGESYGNFERWATHVRYQQIVEAKDVYPVEGTHQSLDLGELEGQPGTEPIRDMDALKTHFEQNISEILCVVEGIDPMQSGTFQALQSYRAEDIVWDAYSQFSPCLSVEKTFLQTVNDVFSVDLERYHDIVPDNEAAVAAANEAAAEAAEKLEAAGLSGTPGDGSVKTARKRHRRIKTLSNRTSDSLFASGAKPVKEKKDLKAPQLRDRKGTWEGKSDNNAKTAEILAKGGIETV